MQCKNSRFNNSLSNENIYRKSCVKIWGISVPDKLLELFEDEVLVLRIKEKLPYLFRLAELESSRAVKIGMEVGVMRERIITALLLYKF